MTDTSAQTQDQDKIYPIYEKPKPRSPLLNSGFAFSLFWINRIKSLTRGRGTKKYNTLTGI